ncbi:SPOR domain-containing protein [Metabacillus malikii]|nr:SPOR domain-containing protein [Metabacillus malikii]
MAGSFTNEENADARVSFLESKRIDAFVIPMTINGTKWYRVQAGAFTNSENAEQRLKQVQDLGIADAFVLTE